MKVDWKEMVRGIAPTLGAALGGPFAGVAVKFLADKLLGNPTATEDQVAEAIVAGSPEQLVKLKELDNAFKVQMKQLDVDVFKLEVGDVQSAREMARVNMWPQIILSTLYTIGYFAVLYIFVVGDVDISVKFKAEFNIVLGVMTAAQVKIMDFWFGSSYGSKIKDERR
jgi:hypothetical protein